MSPKSMAAWCGFTLAILTWTFAAAQNRVPAKRGAVKPALPEAPAGFDNKSNGMVDDATHQADQVKFDDQGKKGKRGEVDVAKQTAEMWMRTIQTTPADLLARKFAIESRGAKR